MFGFTFKRKKSGRYIGFLSHQISAFVSVLKPLLLSIMCLCKYSFHHVVSENSNIFLNETAADNVAVQHPKPVGNVMLATFQFYIKILYFGYTKC